MNNITERLQAWADGTATDTDDIATDALEEILRLRDELKNATEAAQPAEGETLAQKIEYLRGLIVMANRSCDRRQAHIERLRKELDDMTEMWRTEQRERLANFNLVESYGALKAKQEIDALRDELFTIKSAIRYATQEGINQ